jgi:hypothetical protein
LVVLFENAPHRVATEPLSSLFIIAGRSVPERRRDGKYRAVMIRIPPFGLAGQSAIAESRVFSLVEHQLILRGRRRSGKTTSRVFASAPLIGLESFVPVSSIRGIFTLPNACFVLPFAGPLGLMITAA